MLQKKFGFTVVNIHCLDYADAMNHQTPHKNVHLEHPRVVSLLKAYKKIFMNVLEC